MRKPLSRYALRRYCLLAIASFVFVSRPLSAQMPLDELAERVGIKIIAEGSSSRRLRSQNVKQIPLNKMSEFSQRRVKTVLDECAQYRRLPEMQYPVKPQMYRYLVQHPDVAVSTWRVMQISKVEFHQTGPLEYEAMAPDGSLATAKILYQDQSQSVLLCDGTYSSPLLPKPITAAGLVWMRYDYRPNRKGEIEVRQRLDVFVSFPSATARTMAALASPITNMMMDRNAFEVSLYARMMCQAVEKDPEWVEEVASRMEGVLPQRRQQLASIARSVETSRDRTAAVSGRPISNSRPVQMFRASLERVQQPAMTTDKTDGESSGEERAIITPNVVRMLDHADFFDQLAGAAASESASSEQAIKSHPEAATAGAELSDELREAKATNQDVIRL